MNTIYGIFLPLVLLVGMRSNIPPKKGQCPLAGGIMKKLTDQTAVVGTRDATVEIDGKDSIVLSATDGRVTNVLAVTGYLAYIIIRTDTTLYTYADIKRPLVKEGQMVKAGQIIAIAKEQNRITFFVSNYLNKIFNNPDAYVDCVCQLPKPIPAPQ